MYNVKNVFFSFLLLGVAVLLFACTAVRKGNQAIRERISINEGWRFFKYGPTDEVDNLIFDIRPEISDKNDYLVTDAKLTEALDVLSMSCV